VRLASGRKLAKAAGDTSLRAMLDDGRTPAELFGLAARLAGIRDTDAPLDLTELGQLFERRGGGR
jgi:hypothetical protein